jgi:hypothetical protein
MQNGNEDKKPCERAKKNVTKATCLSKNESARSLVLDINHD